MSRRTSLLPRDGEDSELISAVLELVSELRLAEVMRRIVRTASILVDARSAALAVLGADDRVVELIGTNAGSGAGSFGRLLSDGAPLGFLPQPVQSPGQPDDGATPSLSPDTSKALALGVPIRSRRGFRANIYAADRTDGEEFTEGQEALLVSFAAVAGAVIDNAQLYEEGQQREMWVALQGQIATSLLAGVHIDEVLDVVASGARELTGADSSSVLLFDGSAGMVLRAADGQRIRPLVGRTFPAENTVSGGIIQSGEPVLLEDTSPIGPTSEPLLADGGVARAIFVPLVAGGGVIGTLAVGRVAGRSPLNQTDFWLLESFASQVSVALEYGRARSELQRLAVIEDQERIARDLHDNVIQQIFATGMSLLATAHRMTDAAAAKQVEKSVDMLDSVIREIRSAVFALRSPTEDSGGMRQTLQGIASQLFDQSAVTARLHFDGPVDTAISAEAEQHVVATFREALSNVKRHAQATRVDVHLHIGSDVVLRVIDDGVGCRSAPRSGLINLKARAEDLGGEMLLTTRATGGTTLDWRIPLAGPARD